MTDRLIKQMIRWNIIDEEEKDIYRFGLDVLTLKIIYYVSYLFIAILCKEVIEYLIFFISFLLLRKSAGGYHSKTKIGCYILSCLTVIGVIFITKFIILQDIIAMVGAVLLAGADILICWLAPLGSENRELDIEEALYFKKRTRLILILENALILFFISINWKQCVLPLILAIICQAILLLLQYSKQNEFSN